MSDEAPVTYALAAAAGRRRELSGARDDLTEWLSRKLDVSAELSDLRYPVGAGTSSETILATGRWTVAGQRHERELVFRVHPDKFQLFLNPDLTVQYEVLASLHPRGLPVPEALFYESDPGVLGRPFFVMSQIRGQVPVSTPPYNAAGFLFKATPAQRRVAWTTGVETLCEIALVPCEAVAFLDRPEMGATGLDQELEYWRRMMDWVSDGVIPDVYLELHRWLIDHRPTEDVDGFAWGDARIGNMIFGEDFRLAGVVDWEQANLGGARQDLGWWLFFDWFHSDGRGLKRLDGFGSREETIAMWEARVGRPAGDLNWYETFTGFRVALLSIRTYALMGAADPTDVRTNPVLSHTLDLAGLTRPNT
jgi:aminoglycoside phosphotransferase (APT) family kinase protein